MDRNILAPFSFGLEHFGSEYLQFLFLKLKLLSKYVDHMMSNNFLKLKSIQFLCFESSMRLALIELDATKFLENSNFAPVCSVSKNLGNFYFFLVAAASNQGYDLVKNQISKRTFHGNKIKIFKDDLHAA